MQILLSFIHIQRKQSNTTRGNEDKTSGVRTRRPGTLSLAAWGWATLHLPNVSQTNLFLVYFAQGEMNPTT